MKWDNSVFLFSIFFFSSLHSQRVEDQMRSLEAKYPNETFITLIESKKYKIELKDNKPKVYLEDYSEKIIMNELMASYSSGEVSYSKLRKLTDLEAWTMSPIKGEYKKFKVKDFSTKKELGSQIFHDDIEAKVFKFPELRKGAIRCIKENYEFELPEIFDYAVLLSNTPIIKYEVELEVDNEIALHFKEYHFENIKYDFQKTIEKNKTTYHWTFENLKKHKGESMSTPYLYFAPHIRFLIDYYIGKNKDTIRVLQSPKDLYHFNYSFVSKLKPCSNPVFQKKIDSIIKGISDEEQKAKKIYYWVKKNIKYIAFESGFQGYIPREADDIFDKKYGDCKDMANILHKAFLYAGIDSIYLTWVGTDNLPYRIEEFPHPGAFNHMIAVWKHNGKNYILDATNPYTPLGVPSGFVQGKQGFLSLSEKEFEILPIEAVDFSQNRKSKSVNLTFVGDSLVGSAECLVTGYQKDYYLMKMENQSEHDRFQIIKNYLELGNNKFHLIKYKEYNLDQIDSPLRITYDFVLPHYASILKDEIYINPFLEKFGTIDDLNDSRVAGFQIDYKTWDDVHIEFKLPQDYAVKYLPKNENIEFNEYTFNSMFDKDDSTITLNYEFVFDFLTMPKENYKTLKEYQTKVLEALSETISLKKRQ